MARRDDPEPPGVDFVVGPLDTGADEDLPQPADVGTNTASRLRLAAGVLVVLAILVALVVRGVTAQRPNPVAQRSVPATTAAPAPVIPSFSDVATDPFGPGGGTRQPLLLVVHCPRAGRSRPLCTVRYTVGAPVLAAVRAHLPGARIDFVIDEHRVNVLSHPAGIWLRSIEARRGSARIEVTVRMLRASDGPGTSVRDETRTSVTVEHATPAYLVTVSATAPDAKLPDVHHLRALAEDQRLVG